MTVRGRCWLAGPDDEHPRELSPGDLVILPHGDKHWLADRPVEPTRPGMDVMQAVARGEAPFGESETTTTLVCGHFELDRDPEHPLTAALPPMIYLQARRQRDTAWLEPVLWALVDAAGDAAPGSGALADRLAEAVFIHAIRLAIEQSGDQPGFLAALRDVRIGRALGAVHARPEAPWTIEALAREAGMARATFAARFREVAGRTPMDYVTDWRMRRAAELLKESNAGLAEVALRTGFGSQEAFARAFKRRMGQTPGRYRREGA